MSRVKVQKAKSWVYAAATVARLACCALRSFHISATELSWLVEFSSVATMLTGLKARALSVGLGIGVVH